MKYKLILAISLLAATVCHGQNTVINGKLTAYNTFPVMNVEVTSKKAKATTMSDSLGHFSIVCKEKDVVMIKPRVFQSVSQKINSQTDSLNINLIFIDTKKNRELAINSGYLTETNLNYAVANLQEENNDYCKYTDIYTLLQGVVGSSISISNNGEITVRGGNTSFSGMEQALIIVDGQPVTNIDYIRPCVVRSVKVLKDSDAAIYGSRGGNGVVVITTNL